MINILRQTLFNLVIACWKGFLRLLETWPLAIAVFLLPFLVFAVTELYLSAILGIMAAGAVVGVVCAIPIGLSYFKKTNFSKAVLAVFLWSAGGAWISCLMVAVLIAMALD